MISSTPRTSATPAENTLSSKAARYVEPTLSGLGQFAPPAPGQALGHLWPRPASANDWQMFSGLPASPGFPFRAGTPVTYEDVCAKAESDPSGGGGASRCVSFGHPLELWYNTSGAGGGSYNFEFTDAQISEYVNSGRGIDESYASEGSNRSPQPSRAHTGMLLTRACASAWIGSSLPVGAQSTPPPSSVASHAMPTGRSRVPRPWRSPTCWRRRRYTNYG